MPTHRTKQILTKISKKSKPLERVHELQEELRKTKYNKKTQHHIGLVKAKIARLKEQQTKRSPTKTQGYTIKKSGDSTVILLGFPSVGKSTLLNALTNANSEVADYDFTTLKVIPGLLEYNHAKIQILDVPGVVQGASTGKGRGKEVLTSLINADLILILLDVFHPEFLEIIKKELYNSNIRINQQPPDITLQKKSRGGIDLGSTIKLDINKQTLLAILKEFRIFNADIVIREKITIDQFIDFLEGNKKYCPSLIILNKIDMISKKELNNINRKIKPDLAISADKKQNIEALKKLIFDKLNFIRIYCKEYGKEADLKEPLILFKNATLNDMCLKLHKDFISKFKFAKIWGSSVKYPGQKIVKLTHMLKDKDVVELRIK